MPKGQSCVETIGGSKRPAHRRLRTMETPTPMSNSYKRFPLRYAHNTGPSASTHYTVITSIHRTTSGRERSHAVMNIFDVCQYNSSPGSEFNTISIIRSTLPAAAKSTSRWPCNSTHKRPTSEQTVTVHIQDVFILRGLSRQQQPPLRGTSSTVNSLKIQTLLKFSRQVSRHRS